MNKKEHILLLRDGGKSYNEISEIAQCSKSLISYYCGNDQKEKSKDRKRSLMKKNPVLKKIDHFKHSKKCYDKIRNFQARLVGNHYKNTYDRLFSVEDVLKKFGDAPRCYLTGRPIDLLKPKTYSFDHIVPLAKGGGSDLDNLGLTCKEANHAKYDLMAEEFIALCKEVLECQGYSISKSS